MNPVPLSFYQHESLSHFSDVVGSSDKYGHTFGGDPSSIGIRFVNCEPMHLVYRLNQSDPAVSLNIPGLSWLPLCYHFSYASLDGTLIYRVLNDLEIELVAPTESPYDPDFPYSNYPRSFTPTPVAFHRQKYDPTIAEDALQLAGVFGLGQLSASEIQRAIATGKDFGSWSPKEFLRYEHRQPFMQGAPRKSCDNPDCTAEVAYRTEKLTIPMDENYRKLTGEVSLTIEARDVRRDSMRVFALYQPADGDETMWGDPFYQLIFEICECCNCIRVTNQCT